MSLSIRLAAVAVALSSSVLAATPEAVPSQTPKALLDWIYGANHGQPNDDGEKARMYFTSDIVALQKRRQALADTGQLDGMEDDVGDFCSCQDTGNTRYQLTIKPQGADRAEADVLYVNQGERIRYHYFFRLTGPGWRIADLKELSSSLAQGKTPARPSTYKQDLLNEILVAEKTKPHTY